MWNWERTFWQQRKVLEMPKGCNSVICVMLNRKKEIYIAGMKIRAGWLHKSDFAVVTSTENFPVVTWVGMPRSFNNRMLIDEKNVMKMWQNSWECVLLALIFSTSARKYVCKSRLYIMSHDSNARMGSSFANRNQPVGMGA